MRDLQAIRLRFLTAMALGSTACASHPDRRDDRERSGCDYVTYAPVRVEVEPSAIAHRGGACEIDEVREEVCLAVPANEEAGECPLPPIEQARELTPFPRDLQPAPVGYGVDAELTARVRERTDSHVEGHVACCYSRCIKVEVTAAPATPVAPGTDALCIPAPESGTSMPSKDAPACPSALHIGGSPQALSGAFEREQMGPPEPLLDDGSPRVHCCYHLPPGEQQCIMHPRGRPLREGDVLHVTAPADRSDWLPAAGLDTDGDRVAPIAEGAARKWAEAAGAEHASVAAFARLSLSLLAFGAPADLVAGCHAAALDEIEHARIAYALASTAAGAPMGPATLPAAARATPLATLADVAEETLRDGCIGETVAALELFREAAGEEKALAALLTRIGEDELRHAELAFRILAWTVRTDADARARVAATWRRHVAAMSDEHTDVGHDLLAPLVRRLLQ